MLGAGCRAERLIANLMTVATGYAMTGQTVREGYFMSAGSEKLLKPSATHWGAFSAELENGRVTGVRPFARDPDPAQMIQAIPDALYHETRIDQPYVRAGISEKGQG